VLWSSSAVNPAAVHPKLAALANADGPVGGRLRQQRLRLRPTVSWKWKWSERRFQLHLMATCASICNRNRTMTGVRSLRIAPEH
jgi:hypothetical protein